MTKSFFIGFGAVFGPFGGPVGTLRREREEYININVTTPRTTTKTIREINCNTCLVGSASPRLARLRLANSKNQQQPGTTSNSQQQLSVTSSNKQHPPKLATTSTNQQHPTTASFPFRFNFHSETHTKITKIYRKIAKNNLKLLIIIENN